MILSFIYAICTLIYTKDADPADTGLGWIIMSVFEMIFYALVAMLWRTI